MKKIMQGLLPLQRIAETIDIYIIKDYRNSKIDTVDVFGFVFILVIA